MAELQIDRIRAAVVPVVADLRLDLYDLELAGGVLRVTVDTPPGTVQPDGRPGGVDLDTVALATRLISRELDAIDPLPGSYTLEVTSPGLERTLRTPAHFAREVGKQVNVRLRDIGEGNLRRLNGTLVAADDTTFTVRLDDSTPAPGEERVVPYSQLDRAKTVFVWAPATQQPKPGKGPKARTAAASKQQPSPEEGTPS
jgi:ribosome maturation factor RimP